MKQLSLPGQKQKFEEFERAVFRQIFVSDTLDVRWCMIYPVCLVTDSTTRDLVLSRIFERTDFRCIPYRPASVSATS